MLYMRDLFVIVGTHILYMRDMRDLSIVGNRNFNRCSVYLFVDMEIAKITVVLLRICPSVEIAIITVVLLTYS